MSIAEKERNNNAIDMAITLTVDELAAESGEDASKVLSDFMMSGTAHLLYDEESKLWWDGPSAIAQMYREEIGYGGAADCEQTVNNVTMVPGGGVRPH